MAAVRLHEKNEDGLRYMLFCPRKPSTQLIVSFPACAKKGSRYNYLRTIKDYDCYKLFLLDEGASNHRGTYLLGDVHEKVRRLISGIVEKYGIKESFFIGSSKGGYCAVDFSFFIPNAIPIIAAPQYFVGFYLNSQSFLPNLWAVLGGVKITDAGIAKVDNRLREVIETSDIKPSKVYINYSDKEHTYGEHIKFMLEDLHKAGIEVVEQVEHYPNHGDLIKTYPTFLRTVLKELVV